MTINVQEYVPSNLQSVALYAEMIDDIQFILGKGEVQLSTSYNNAIANIVIDITDIGTGTHTLESSLSRLSNAFTVDVATDTLTLTSFLDLEKGTKVRLINVDGVLPTGLSIDTDYFIAKTIAIATYVDVKNKYKDFLSLDNEIVQKIISEQGYDYIVEVLNLLKLSTIDSKIFLGYLGIVHFFKGHRRGLELVFSILKHDHVLTEWWEKSPQGTPDTYDLTVNVDMAVHEFDDIDAIEEGIRTFTEQYVYPVLDEYVIKPTLKVQSPLYVGAVFLSGEEVTIFPPIEATVTVQSATPYIAGALLTSETITVSPPL